MRPAGGAHGWRLAHEKAPVLVRITVDAFKGPSCFSSPPKRLQCVAVCVCVCVCVCVRACVCVCVCLSPSSPWSPSTQGGFGIKDTFFFRKKENTSYMLITQLYE